MNPGWVMVLGITVAVVDLYALMAIMYRGAFGEWP